MKISALPLLDLLQVPMAAGVGSHPPATLQGPYGVIAPLANQAGRMGLLAGLVLRGKEPGGARGCEIIKKSTICLAEAAYAGLATGDFPGPRPGAPAAC